MKIINTFRNLGLHNRLAIFSLSLIVIQTMGLGFVASYYLHSSLEQQIGMRAMSVAKSLVNSPIIRQGLLTKNNRVIQEYIEVIRLNTKARFIVIGDTNGIRYSHPDPEKIGQKMVGGDNDGALLQGQSYTSIALGTLGKSLRAKSPIYSKQGDIIGVISVGYLEQDIQDIIAKFKITFHLILGMILLTGILVTVYIAKRYRDDIFGLEPEEIAQIFTERDAVLTSILEALIVVNEHGMVTSVNRIALELLGNLSREAVVGHDIELLLPAYPLLLIDDDQQLYRDIEIELNNQAMILTKTPLLIKHKNKGVVLTFRLKDDIVTLSKKLSQVQQFSTMLQVQTHEYSNKLNTIGGLIQIGSLDEALELIFSENSGYQQLIELLIDVVDDPVIAGFILGKYNVAKEQNITFEIDKESSLKAIPEHIVPEKLVTILGNILENAFDASLKHNKKKAIVKFHMTDIGHDLIFEVEDNGCGISRELEMEMFSLGKTTKQSMGHGIGMYLVKTCLDQLKGSISITTAKSGGTIVTVYIPKCKLSSKDL
ncbi:MAG: sensor histidine kinase [Gammaproteobacteria bacterium]|nr:sensor histidine kinase [Gammaproteobacteria bacterium]